MIVTVRDKNTDVSALESIPKGDGSTLFITYLPISTTSTSEIEKSHEALIESLHNYEIKKVDVVIANAGAGTVFMSTAETPLSAISADFYANTIGPIALYQSLLPLLKGSAGAKFIIIGSSLGSISAMIPGAPCLSYGISKAAVHFAAKKMHDEEKNNVVLVVHPG